MKLLLVIASLLIASTSSALAQSAPDPRGRWLGSIQAPFGEVAIELNFIRTPKGALVGTYDNVRQGVALPLAGIAVTGNAVTFELRADGGGRFDGTFSGDGRAVVGNFKTGEVIVPFVVAYSGDAKANLLPVNRPIDRSFEGSWAATVAVQNLSIPVVLTLANESDQTATGTLVNVNTGLELPLTLTQNGTVLSLTHPAVGQNFFSGSVSPDGTAIAGTFTQGAVTAPLTFTKTAN